MAGVTIRGIKKSYGKTEVIHGIDLDIKNGEFVVLLGPSGCGKSTLLRMIAGLEPISAGTVSIGGEVVNDLHPKDRNIAMVFQNYALYAHMSVFDNMAFSMQLKKLPKDEIAKKVEWAAGILNLTDYLARYPRELSGGQRQRVAMGRAIVRDPAVFLFDEPLSNLDAKLRVQMRTEIKELHQKLGTTIVYVTHDQIEAMTMADRIVVLKDGYIEQVGPPLDVYDRPANMFVAGFLGSPSMNFIRGLLLRRDGRVLFDAPVFQADVSDYAFATPPGDGQPTVLGIRPEHLRLVDPQAPRNAQATVGLIEPMGANKIAWLDAQGTQLALQTDPSAQLVSDTLAHLAMDAAHVSLFDASTEIRL